MNKKSLSVQIPRAEFKKSKFEKIYNTFRTKILKIVGKKSFVVAVSGGPDSLALAYFSKQYGKEFKNLIKYVIVDHNIRKNSDIEAKKVKKILNKENMNLNILSWKDPVPKKNIQFNARKIRYSLILKYCLKYKIRYVLTAHHQDDQIENFLIRLFRGSGIVGLSSMGEESQLIKKLKVVRPLLTIEKKHLKHVAKKTFGTYIKDPSNTNPIFLRTRIRKYRQLFDKEGFDMKKILNTINNLASAKIALDFYKSQAIKKHVKFLKKKQCKIDLKLFKEEAKETSFRTLSEIFKILTSNNYPPRSKKILNLILSLKKKSFKKSLLAGFEIRKLENYIIISKISKKTL